MEVRASFRECSEGVYLLGLEFLADQLKNNEDYLSYKRSHLLDQGYLVFYKLENNGEGSSSNLGVRNPHFCLW